MAGRKAKPTVLRLLEGNRSRRPINSLEPQPLGELREPPDWFNAEQRDAWDYAIANAPVGLLRRIDASVLCIWTVASVLHRKATESLARTSPIVKTPNGSWQQNPFLPVVNRQAEIMLRSAAELGFTPASRPRMSVQPAAEGASLTATDAYFA